MQASQIEVGRHAGEHVGRGSTGTDWSVSIDRGPDWLFIRLEPPRRLGDDAVVDRLDDHVWQTIREHGAHRVVLELDRVQAINEGLIDMIAAVGTRVRDDGGLLRVCGLSRPNLDRLRRSTNAADVPHFGSRAEAVIARGDLGG
jgi:hypothetical protein